MGSSTSYHVTTNSSDPEGYNSTKIIYAVGEEDVLAVVESSFCDIKASGTWTEAKAVEVKTAGAWEDACRMYYKENGEWLAIGTGLGKLTLTVKDASGNAVSGAAVTLSMSAAPADNDWNLEDLIVASSTGTPEPM